MEQLTVELPTDLIAAMQAEATERGVTVDDLIEEAFRHVRGRVITDPKYKALQERP
ncbi:hypothetical protein ACQPW3_10725 [Actinosynnema sp. CA-248983]